MDDDGWMMDDDDDGWFFNTQKHYLNLYKRQSEQTGTWSLEPPPSPWSRPRVTMTITTIKFVTSGQTLNENCILTTRSNQTRPCSSASST
jgi:hypothetical protein